MREESSKYGTVEAVTVPMPPAAVHDLEPARVYVMFATPEECSKAHAGATHLRGLFCPVPQQHL